MAVELIVAPEAERDLAEAYGWYEDQRVGLGEELLIRVDACIQRIVRSPELSKKIHKNYRRGFVRRFPYAVVYEYQSDIVTIYGIFHTSGDPAKWKKRLP